MGRGRRTQQQQSDAAKIRGNNENRNRPVYVKATRFAERDEKKIRVNERVRIRRKDSDVVLTCMINENSRKASIPE